MKKTLGMMGALLGIAVAAHAQLPVITAVQDAATYTANIAQGSVFVVKGTNLSGSGFVQASASPLVTTIPGTGVKITFTSIPDGKVTDALMFYTYNQAGVNQLAALLPSQAAPGTYNVMVTYNGAESLPFRATVVAHKFGLITVDGSGSGMVLLQNYVSGNYDVNRFTTYGASGYTFSPSHPGQIVVAWGTGLGPLPNNGNDAVPPGSVDFRSLGIKVIVGDKTITLPAGDGNTYGGRSPSLPGTDELVFALPSDVQTGCTVPFQVSVGGQLSNPTTIAIAPAGSDACTVPGISKDALTKLDQGGTFTAGSFQLSQISTTMSLVPGMAPLSAKLESASGVFTNYKAAQLVDATVFLNPTNSCQVFHRIGTQSQLIYGQATTDLNAGAITLTGPNSLNKAFTKSQDNAYSLALGTAITGISIPGYNANPVITQGTYQLAGAGGTEIGKFTASVTVGTPLTLSPDLPSTVTRSKDLALAWMGGNSTDIVAILGMSGAITNTDPNNPIYDADVFICTTTAGKNGFTVPTSVLQQLPVTPANTGAGLLMVLSATQPSAGNGIFTAPLVKGGNIDSGIFQGTVGFMSMASYQ